MRDERVEALERRIAELDRAEQERAQRIAELEAAIVRRPRWRARSVMAAALVLSIGISGVAVGVTGSPLLEGARNPAVGSASQQTSFVSNNATGYTAAMQNVNSSDGGALAGTCQATLAREGCIAGANFGSGRAFDFFAAGQEAGRIQVANPASKPLTTNAAGVATGFNADKVDGKDASELSGVVGYGELKAPCVAHDNCPLRKNRNVTSVRHPELFPGVHARWYCIAVAGADPRRNLIMAGPSGFNVGNVSTGAQHDDTEDHTCATGEFAISTYIGLSEVQNVSFWFAVLR